MYNIAVKSKRAGFGSMAVDNLIPFFIILNW